MNLASVCLVALLTGLMITLGASHIEAADRITVRTGDDYPGVIVILSIHPDAVYFTSDGAKVTLCWSDIRSVTTKAGTVRVDPKTGKKSFEKTENQIEVKLPTPVRSTPPRSPNSGITERPRSTNSVWRPTPQEQDTILQLHSLNAYQKAKLREMVIVQGYDWDNMTLDQRVPIAGKIFLADQREADRRNAIIDAQLKEMRQRQLMAQQQVAMNLPGRLNSAAPPTRGSSYGTLENETVGKIAVTAFVIWGGLKYLQRFFADNGPAVAGPTYNPPPSSPSTLHVTIRGVLKDLNGRPVTFRSITFEGSAGILQGSATRTVQTGSSGEFELPTTFNTTYTHATVAGTITSGPAKKIEFNPNIQVLYFKGSLNLTYPHK